MTQETIDLETAKPGDVFIRRNGDECTYMGKSPYQSKYPFAFAIEGGNWGNYTRKGAHIHDDEETPYDIIRKKSVKQRRWLNIYSSGETCFYSSREDADFFGKAYSLHVCKRIACIEIEYEEGQGL